MEIFTSLQKVMTPEVAVLVRAALIAALIFGIEALGKVRRGVRSEGRNVNVRGHQLSYTKREQLSKKRTLRA